MRAILLTLSLCTFATFGIHATLESPSSPEIKIEYVGNCGFHMTDGSTHFYVDFPYKSGAYGYMEYEASYLDSIRENSLFLFTHKHADHYSAKTLQTVLKEKGGRAFGVSNISELAGLTQTVEDFSIQAYKTKHAFFGIPFRHYSYLITWHGKRIFISGDTTDPETIAEQKDLELAMVPYWILNNAKEEGIEIDAKRFAVYHLYPSQIPDAVAQLEEIAHIFPLIEQGQIVKIGR